MLRAGVLLLMLPLSTKGWWVGERDAVRPWLVKARDMLQLQLQLFVVSFNEAPNSLKST